MLPIQHDDQDGHIISAENQSFVNRLLNTGYEYEWLCEGVGCNVLAVSRSATNSGSLLWELKELLPDLVGGGDQSCAVPLYEKAGL